MDFPMFHIDWLNNRFLIAAIAVLHVLINHGLAVGFIPYIVWLERKGVLRAKSSEVVDLEWDNVVYKKMKVAFIVTTTVGAMTGVGIWFSAALISPTSIASLLRVFFWAWFVEWLVFVTEVVLILVYFLSWKRSNQNIHAKNKHIRLGWYLAAFSWITMAIIVSILGFMMDPGNWLADKSLLNGFTNPIYIPQLAFRTPTAMLIGGIFGMVLTTLFVRRITTIRKDMVKFAGVWMLVWAPLSMLGAILYYQVLPEAMLANMSTAVGTMDFELYYDMLKYFIVAAACLGIPIAGFAWLSPQRVRLVYVIIPCMFLFGFLGLFERVREFIRKPYIIGDYMYSNLLLEKDYPLYSQEGILKHATYVRHAEVNDSNLVEAGKDVFMLACSRCHTAKGINSIVENFEKMYGQGPLDPGALEAYIPVMHKGRTYMPPFPGNRDELKALVAYIKQLQVSGESLSGAESEGVKINPSHTIDHLGAFLVNQKMKKEQQPISSAK